MKLVYNNKEIISGTHLTPLQTREEPEIEYIANPNKLYTLIMYDPDAQVGNYVHWVTINVPGNAISHGQQLLNYKGPAPPQGTGIHRYIFLIFEQGKRINAQNIPESKRSMTMNELYRDLNADLHLNSTSYFTSEYEKSGGRKRKRNNITKKRAPRRKKSTKNR